MFLPFPFPTRTTLETRCNVRQSVWQNVKLSVALVVALPEKSSTIVIKMLHQVLEDSRKASKSGAETYAKVICLCDETRHEAVAVTEQTIRWLERLTADQQMVCLRIVVRRTDESYHAASPITMITRKYVKRKRRKKREKRKREKKGKKRKKKEKKGKKGKKKKKQRRKK